MPTLSDYVVLSAIIYNDVRGVDNKLIPLPANWNELLYDTNPGFTAGAYQNGNDIVIAFKGSDDLATFNENSANDWLLTNIPTGLARRLG